MQMIRIENEIKEIMKSTLPWERECGLIEIENVEENEGERGMINNMKKVRKTLKNGFFFEEWDSFSELQPN